VSREEVLPWDSLIERAARAVKKGKCRATYTGVAEFLGIKTETVRSAFRRRGIKGENMADPDSWERAAAPGAEDLGQSDTIEREGDVINISLKNTRIHTLEELVEYAEVDLEEWAVERFTVNSWEMGRKAKVVDLEWEDGRATGSVADSGKMRVEKLFQVKATLVRRVLKLAVEDELRAMKEAAFKQAPLWRPVERKPRGKTGYLLEISIPDAHLGKLAWGKATGHGDYDLKIAHDLYVQALAALLDRTSSFWPDRVLYVVGNDLLHVDNDRNQTNKGTQLESDSRYHKIFRVAREMITQSVERLRQLSPVDIEVVPGNHDLLAAWHLGDSLEAYFHGAKDVEIFNDPTPRKYYQWGKVMLMLTHQATNKRLRDDYPLLMATEQPKMFGDTRFREVHLGDLHQVRLEEQHGVRTRILPSLTAPDQWHSDKGFVGGIRSAEAFVWHREDGLVGTATFSLPDL
jgi:hypothetical protein